MTNSTHSSLTSLETLYAHVIFQDFNVLENHGFQNYHRTQNEWPPQNVKPHLDQAQPGNMVVTGSERLFLNLLFSDEELYEGFIGRDISPQAKAYIDFNILLLRISENMQEYEELSEPTAWWDKDNRTIFAHRVKVITEKTQNNDLPQQVKDYYLKNIKSFASVYLYLGRRGDWRKDPRFSAGWYHKNKEQFLKLQRYAKAGNIIATIGDINDLKFLKNTKINVVDTSNIHDYCVVHLQGAGDFCPRVIWTELSLNETCYYSSPYTRHEPLNETEEKESQTWSALFQKTHLGIGTSKHYFQILTEKLNLEPSSLRNNPKKVLNKFRKYMKESVLTDPNQRMITDPTLGYVPLSNLNEINTLSIEQINTLCHNPQIRQHLPFLIGKINSLKPEYSLAFLKIQGAKEEFERQCSDLTINLGHILNTSSDGHLLALTQEFGRTRFALLKSRVAFQRSLPFLAKVGIFVTGLAALGGYWMMQGANPNTTTTG